MTAGEAEKLRERLVAYASDPVAFSRDVFGASLDPWQDNALELIHNNRKVAIAGCTGCGKDHMVAHAIWWFLLTHPYCKIICTAVKEDTLRDNLFAELSLLMRKSPLIGSLVNVGATKISVKGAEAEWFIVARTANKKVSADGSGSQAEGLAGKYSKYVLNVIDEACHDDRTEVMTSRGWMRFSDVENAGPGLTILGMDPKTRKAEFYSEWTLQKHAKHGVLYEYSEDGYSFCVTGKHRFLYRLEPRGSWCRSALTAIMPKVFYIPVGIKEPSSLAYALCDPEAHSIIRIDSSRIREVEYSGNVYCFDLPPHHLLYTRRDGKPIWTCNSGVDDSIFDALEGSANTPDRKIVAIGNPLRRVGRFANIYLDERFKSDWSRMNVSYLDSSQTNGPDERAIRERWIEQYGESSAFVQARVYGRFPVASTDDTVFSTEEIRLARGRRIKDDPSLDLCIGIDVARYGMDETVYYVRRGDCSIEMVCQAQTSSVEVVRMAKQLANKWVEADSEDTVKRKARFIIDETGVGSGVVDPLVDEGWRVSGVHNGSRSRFHEEYYNLGAQIWLLDAKVAIQVASLIDDDLLASQLESRQFRFTGTGKQRRLTGKDEMRKRGLSSPDRADAFTLAFASDETVGLGIIDIKNSIAFV